MPSPNPPQRLQDLDRSSPEFPSRLTDTLLGEGSVNRAQNIPDEELGPFIEYLDIALNDLDPTSNAFCHCLFELRRICGTYKVLPTSHVLLDTVLNVSDHPATPGALPDTHEGTLKGSRVRVKKVRMYSKEDPQKVKIFYQEAVLWKHMDHPSIVPFRGATLNPLQLVSNWMQAGNLTEYTNKHPGINRLGLLCDVAEGINYLHSRNVVHGGIKGANILVDHFGRARITDFSLAGFGRHQGPTHHTVEAHDYNTRWTAPEVLEKTGPLTEEADIFSFGMVMVEVFTGMVPFNHIRSVASALEIIRGERPPRPDNPTLTDNVWELIRTCWGQEPRSRPVISTVLRDLVSNLLQSLHEFAKSSPEFQVALSQFYDSTVRKGCVSRLYGAELKAFVNFLDDVLRIEELSEGLRQQTLHNLQEVFDSWATHPKSHAIHREFSKSTADPYAVNKYAKVWRGQVNSGEVDDPPVDACLKSIRIEAVHKEFRGEVAVWTKLNHPNILRCFGVTIDPFQIVTEWMPNGHAMGYIQAHRGADRVRLLIDIARGLEYLHSHGVVHGNMKQQNILIDSAGRACLSDVGFSTLTPNGKSQFDWAKVGADGHRWAAPELFESGKLSEQSDVFSYGFVAAEIFVGELLWGGIDAAEVKSRIVNGERPCRPKGTNKHILTTRLWRIFTKCWETEPERRISVSQALSILQYLPQPSHGASPGLETTQGQARTGQEQIDELDEGGVGNEDDILSMIIPRLDTGSTPAPCRGGFADVYRGKYKGRTVAIKVPRLYTRNDPDLDLSRFCREAVVWRHLKHPNILPLLGATLGTHEFAFVSEWMVNGNINEFIQKHTEVNRVQLLVDVAHGLEYLHSLNFIHGDLKGANILIKKDHRACLADFGFSTIGYVAPQPFADISTPYEASIASTSSEVSLIPHSSGGSTRWMSPELLDPKKFGLKNQRPTKQSDCYALGMVIYEVLYGRVPYWDRKRDPMVMKAILEGVRPAKPNAAASLGFTDGLWWAVECCWMADRGIRPDVKIVLSHLTRAVSAWDDHREIVF